MNENIAGGSCAAILSPPNKSAKTVIDVREISVCGVDAVELCGLEFFDLAAIFECGQAFRFERVRSPEQPYVCEYKGIAMGREISVANTKNGTVRIIGSNAADYNDIWREYFSLDRDYKAMRADIASHSGNAALAAAMEYGSGIRILKQDPWEALCSFIISQNNNIPRIKGLVSALCRSLGTPIGNNAFAFPSPTAVAEASEERLRRLKTGFRAPYISDAAKKIASGEIDLGAVATAPATEGARILTKIKGVGPKVAACTLLFGFGKFDAFPIDVWIRRSLAKYLPQGADPASLGKYAGLAQQYIFYKERADAAAQA